MRTTGTRLGVEMDPKAGSWKPQSNKTPNEKCEPHELAFLKMYICDSSKCPRVPKLRVLLFSGLLLPIHCRILINHDCSVVVVRLYSTFKGHFKETGNTPRVIYRKDFQQTK